MRRRRSLSANFSRISSTGHDESGDIKGNKKTIEVALNGAICQVRSEHGSVRYWKDWDGRPIT